ncbi:non-ribosomal peptide synthetase [Streptomyces sp. PmtG]
MSGPAPDAATTHSAACRVPPGFAPPPGVRAWHEPVPADSGSAEALRRRERELRRPLGSARQRLVLLRYADGVTDAVVTARHEVPLAQVLRGTDQAPDARGSSDAPAPEPAPTPPGSPPLWGLGSGAPGLGRHVHTVTAPDEADHVIGAALEFVLSRYEGRPLDGVTAREATVRSTSGVVLTAVEPPPATGFPLLDHLPHQAPPHPLTICPRREPGTGQLTLRFLYRTDWFAPAAVERLARHLAHALAQLSGAGPAAPLGNLELLDADERARLLPPPSGAAPGRRQGATLHRLFAEQAARHRDRTAVISGPETLSYGELDLRARRVAAALRAAGAGPGTRVAVCVERSADLPVVLLAVVRAGAAYVPLDPSQPPDRLRYLLRDAAPVLLVADAEHAPDGIDLPRYDIAGLLAHGGAPGHDDPADDATPDDPAYVIYTSGSTGEPKGVVVPHRNVAALLDATADDFGLGEGDVWTLFHSAAFDFSVWEMWGCLLTGGCLVVVEYWVSRSPDEFRALLAERGVTVLSQTPSAFGQLARADEEAARRGGGPLALRLVVFGGEPLDTRTLPPWFDRYPPSTCRLVNMYGITETTVHVTARTLTRADALAGSRSVGRALPGWHVHIADERGGPLPVGVPGEIHVSGAGLALAYLGRPELTAERFVTDPDTGRRDYRSGDRGRLLPDGTLEHLGRLDAQVQLRGFRVEPGEARAALLRHPLVTDAAVTVAEAGTDHARLDAYVVLAAGAGTVAPAEIRAAAARFLPAYMVPSTVTELPALPLTANGKLDAARLPRPARTAAPAAEAAPAEATDGQGALLLSLWAELFGTPVGLDDDFFQLGGNSLLAVRLSAALRDRDLPAVSVRDLYRAPTVRGLLRALAPGAPPPAARPARRGRLLDLP